MKNNNILKLIIVVAVQIIFLYIGKFTNFIDIALVITSLVSVIYITLKTIETIIIHTNVEYIIKELGLPCLAVDANKLECLSYKEILNDYKLIDEEELIKLESNDDLEKVVFISYNLEYEANHEEFKKIMKTNLNKNIEHYCYVIKNDLTMGRIDEMSDYYNSEFLHFYEIDESFKFMFSLYSIAIYKMSEGKKYGYLCIDEDVADAQGLYRKLSLKDTQRIIGMLDNMMKEGAIKKIPRSNMENS